jgi:hypothetical protein
MQTSIKPAAALWLSISLCLSACSGEPGAEAPAQSAPPPPEVEVVTVRPREVALDLEYSGRATGSQEVEVRARVSGILLRRHYQEGAAVQEGAVLFEIDPQPYEVALERVRAGVQVAQAQLSAAERDWKRAEAVFAGGAISESDHDRIRSAFELAEAAIAVARAEQQAAEINLGYTTVTAPISGITSRAAVHLRVRDDPRARRNAADRSCTGSRTAAFPADRDDLAGLHDGLHTTGDQQRRRFGESYCAGDGCHRWHDGGDLYRDLLHSAVFQVDCGDYPDSLRILPLVPTRSVGTSRSGLTQCHSDHNRLPG